VKKEFTSAVHNLLCCDEQTEFLLGRIKGNEGENWPLSSYAEAKKWDVADALRPNIY